MKIMLSHVLPLTNVQLAGWDTVQPIHHVQNVTKDLPVHKVQHTIKMDVVHVVKVLIAIKKVQKNAMNVQSIRINHKILTQALNVSLVQLVSIKNQKVNLLALIWVV